MAEPALDDNQRDALAGHLDDIRDGVDAAQGVAARQSTMITPRSRRPWRLSPAARMTATISSMSARKAQEGCSHIWVLRFDRVGTRTTVPEPLVRANWVPGMYVFFAVHASYGEQ